MTKRLLLILGVVVAITASVAAFYRGNRGGDVPAFTTATARMGDVVATVEATGTLSAVTTVQVGSQVSGTIKSLHADFNSRVKRGQVIARLEPSLLQAQVEQAEATVVRLEADVERSRVALEDADVKARRSRELFAQGLIARADLEAAESTARQAAASVKAAEAQVTQGRAALNQNRVNLGHTVITAPVEGIVISRAVDVGQTVAASMSAPTLFVIAEDLARMRVDASVDEADIGRIEPGQHVQFHVDAYPDDVFTGAVAQVRLEPTVVQNVVSYVTVIDVPNPDGLLKPGMTATVSIEAARANDAIVVPNAALRFQPDGETGARGTRVWAVDGPMLRPVPVKAGVSNGTETAIVGGELREGMTLATGNAAANATTRSPSTTSPLMPQRARAGRQGGGR